MFEKYQQRIDELKQKIKDLDMVYKQKTYYMHSVSEISSKSSLNDMREELRIINDEINDLGEIIETIEKEQDRLIDMANGVIPFLQPSELGIDSKPVKPVSDTGFSKSQLEQIPTVAQPSNDEEFVDAEDETPPPQPTMADLENERDRIEAELEAAINANDLDLEDELRENLKAIKTEIRNLSKASTAGSGLKKRRGRPKGSGISFKDNIDHAKGIQPVKKYHPFGKYFVNSHKLNNGNVLSIKSKSGTNIREYPSKTVSRNLGHVIKTIIGGGVPSWNDMEKLTNDEKDYLYKVSKRAEFSDKITIPTPSKDQQEKDIHEFDVCKGEIMAGNDSKELIKKFKLLIIKLSKNGSIPKREASEVMQELLELGY